MDTPLQRRRRPAPIIVPTSWVTAAGETAEVYPARPGPANPQKWHWRVIAPSGRILARSDQRFNRPRSARRSLARKFPPAPPAAR